MQVMQGLRDVHSGCQKSSLSRAGICRGLSLFSVGVVQEGRARGYAGTCLGDWPHQEGQGSSTTNPLNVEVPQGTCRGYPAAIPGNPKYRASSFRCRPCCWGPSAQFRHEHQSQAFKVSSQETWLVSSFRTGRILSACGCKTFGEAWRAVWPWRNHFTSLNLVFKMEILICIL